MAMKNILSTITGKRRGRMSSSCGSMNDDTHKTVSSVTETGSCSSLQPQQAQVQQQQPEGDHPDWFPEAFFREELLYVRYHPQITKVTFKNYVERHERDDLLALQDIFKADRRRWKAVKFQDNIPAKNYRRWQFKKENLRRSVDQALKDAGIRDKVPIYFEEHLQVDMDEQSCPAICSLLREVQKDRHVMSITLDGFVAQANVEPIVGVLMSLLMIQGRKWRSVVFRCSFDGDSDEYNEWIRKIAVARRRLNDISAERGIPLGFHVC